jgi:hypothetical protein
MSRFRKAVDPERDSGATSARQPHTPAVPDRCSTTRGMQDLAPPLVSRIATSFWCQTTSRATAGRHQVAPPIQRKRTSPAKSEQFLTSVALVLVAVAAILSTPGHSDKIHRMSQWLGTGAAAEAAATAGAIGEDPDLLGGW